MGYQKIPNLYKDTQILELFKECYVLEKIHGTSAGIHWKPWRYPLAFHISGAKYDQFVSLFNVEELTARFKTLFPKDKVSIYGEAYGGKAQGMRDTYGPNLQFVAFEVKVGDCWLAVPQAEDVATNLGLDFVWYTRVPTDLEEINRLRDQDSQQAIKNGMGEGHKAEGVVIRPLVELTKNNGERLVVKHKRDDFRETKTPREVDPEKLKKLSEAQEIAREWVTEMRLQHVLDALSAQGEEASTIEDTGKVVKAMLKDVKDESEGEIEWSKEAEKAIGKAAAQKFKKRVTEVKV